MSAPSNSPVRVEIRRKRWPPPSEPSKTMCQRCGQTVDKVCQTPADVAFCPRLRQR